MGLEDIKILCIIPCFNAQDTITRAIESVINQSYQNWKLVIVDDASIDKTVNIIKPYLKDSRITLLQNKVNKGCYYSRNRGLFYSKDKSWHVFTIHDADDSSSEDRFLQYVTFFSKNENAEVIKGVFQGKRWRGDKNKKFIKFQKQYAAGINWYKRSVFEIFGYFDNTRFSGDKEYVDRIQYYLQACFGSDPEKYEQECKKVLLKPNLDFSYVYTVHPSRDSLSISYTKEEKQNYIKKYQDRFNNFSTLEDFHYFFTPEQQDL